MATIKALVKPALLRWARDRAKVKLEDAAKAAHVSAERLEGWERDGNDDAPTLGQLRDLAGKYHFPLRDFYLPEPPKDFAPLRDFRRLRDAEEEPISANLAFHIRSAYDRRELALELFQELDSEPPRFPLKATIRDDPEQVGRSIREFLKVDSESQQRAARQGRAFDFWRRRLEENDVLVFLISGPHWRVDLKEMRGFTIAMPELPVIVVNGRDDSQGGKAFTLVHELCHVLLGESAISNGAGDYPTLKPADRSIERFCDAVAAATLMPRELVLSFREAAGSGVREWSDAELGRISGAIGASRQALLLRFVTLNRASWEHYKEWEEVFEEEYRQRAEDRAQEKKSVPIKRHVMVMSWNGRGFTRLVLRSYYDQRITLNDVSSYLGAKVKHIPALERAAFQPADERGRMVVYCIDTSALIAAWQERYPIENFPPFWRRVDSLINDGRLTAPMEVFRETGRRSDELHTWLSARRQMFRELEEAIQIEAASVLAQFPRLVGERKLRTSADPFVIALARVANVPIVTDEKPTGNLQRPNIPDVCTALGMLPCMGLLQLIQAEKWVIG